MDTRNLTLFPLDTSKKVDPSSFFSTRPPDHLDDYERREIAAAIRAEGERLLGDDSESWAGSRGARLIAEADRFCNCGKTLDIWQCDTEGRRFSIPQSCNSRICEKCSRRYFRKFRQSIETALAPCFRLPRRGWGVFLLTLTVQKDRFGGDLPDRDQIRRFYAESYQLLKLFYGRYQCELTKKNKVVEINRHYKRSHGKPDKSRPIEPVRHFHKNGRITRDYRQPRGAGYITTTEIGPHNTNLHCHAIVYGPFIPVRLIKAAWRKITGDSFIVDIRQVKKPAQAIGYVMKYITKPPALRGFEDYARYAGMIKGVRRLRAGGIFFDRISKEKPDDKLKFCCPYCASRLVKPDPDQPAPDEITVELLYPLLRQVKTRGTPLGPPLPSLMDKQVAELARNWEFANNMHELS